MVVNQRLPVFRDNLERYLVRMLGGSMGYLPIHNYGRYTDLNRVYFAWVPHLYLSEDHFTTMDFKQLKAL